MSTTVSLRPSDDEAHAFRVAAFRADLAQEAVRDVIRKHITTGDPVAIERDVYYDVRRRIADRFNIHPAFVILVGSCRTGFSLKPQRRYVPVRADSDIDIAVISPDLFDSYWDSVFHRAVEDQGWARCQGKSFVSELFKGWIKPRDLPNLPRFKDGRLWAEFFDEMNQRRVCGFRTISARLYRTWDRLEAYQAILVSKCRAEILRGGK